jgi:hypothetical protein
MKKSIDIRSLLQIMSYSAEPYFIDNESFTGIFDSIEILEDCIITVLTDIDDNNLVTRYNLSGKTLPAGTQLTGYQEFKTITTTGLVKLNMTNLIE